MNHGTICATSNLGAVFRISCFGSAWTRYSYSLQIHGDSRKPSLESRTPCIYASILIRWSEVLLELAQFHGDPESKKMVLDVISKLEEAVEVEPRKHDTLWSTPVNIIIGYHVWVEDLVVAWIGGQATKMNGQEAKIQWTDGKKIRHPVLIFHVREGKGSSHSLWCKEFVKFLHHSKVDSLKLQLDDLEKQMDSLKAAFVPIQDEVDRLEELGNMICAEEREISSLMLGSKQLKEKDIDKSSTEINRRKVQIETGQKMMKKLTKGIEELKNEKERLTQEREKLCSTFTETEQKAFTVQENYKKTQEVSFLFVCACANWRLACELL